MLGCILISLSGYHQKPSLKKVARPFRKILMQDAKAPGQVMRTGRAMAAQQWCFKHH
jgi:hypothetical protein